MDIPSESRFSGYSDQDRSIVPKMPFAIKIYGKNLEILKTVTIIISPSESRAPLNRCGGVV
jgi:hypothetical protein